MHVIVTFYDNAAPGRFLVRTVVAGRILTEQLVDNAAAKAALAAAGKLAPSP